MTDEKKTGEVRGIDDEELIKAAGGYVKYAPLPTCPDCYAVFSNMAEYKAHRKVCKKPS